MPPSSVSSHTTVVCGQCFSPSGHQWKKVWLIAVGKNDPETPCSEGPELIVRFYSQKTEHISSLLIVLCFQKVMVLLPGTLLLEFSSVLAELFLPLPMITVLASRTRQHLILISKPPFPKLKGHWWGTLWEADSFSGPCHVNSYPSNRTPSPHITELNRKKRWNVKENLSQTSACGKTWQWYGAKGGESVDPDSIERGKWKWQGWRIWGACRVSNSLSRKNRKRFRKDFNTLKSSTLWGICSLPKAEDVLSLPQLHHPTLTPFFLSYPIRPHQHSVPFPRSLASFSESGRLSN